MIEPRPDITAPMREADAEIMNYLDRARRRLEATANLDNPIDNADWIKQHGFLSRAMRTWEKFIGRERMALASERSMKTLEALPAVDSHQNADGIARAQALSAKRQAKIGKTATTKRWG